MGKLRESAGLFALILLSILAIGSSISIVTVDGANPEVEGTYNSISWSLAGDTLTISPYGTSVYHSTGDFDNAYDGPLRPPWESFKDQIKIVNITEGVDGIGSYIFQRYTDLRTVYLPESLQNLGYLAFSSSGIENITVYQNTTVGTGAFNTCEKLTHADIRCSELSVNTFYLCTALKSVEMPNVENISTNCFAGCKAIEYISFSSKLNNVSEQAFFGLEFYYSGEKTDPTANNLAGRTWTGSGNSKLYSGSEGLTITFDANGGQCSTTTMSTNSKHMLSSLPSASRNGYSFIAWYTSKIGGEEVTTSTVFDFNCTVYAIWKENPDPLITFDANGGECGMISISTNKDGTLSSLPKATKLMCDLKGWYTQSEGGTKITTTYVFDKDTTIYAQWEPITLFGLDIMIVAIILIVILAIIVVCGIIHQKNKNQ